MAKTIKFNLICDGNPVRTLDDLRNNFCAEDMLQYFHNGLLERWLTVRGFTEELEKFKKISPQNDIHIIKELAKIFGVDSELSDVEKDTYIFTYKQEQQASLKKYEEQEYKRKSIIEDYHAGYEALLDKIIDNKDNLPVIKAAVQEIDEKYFTLFRMQADQVGWLLVNDKAPMAILAMLMRDSMRKLFMPDENNICSKLMRPGKDDEHNTSFDYTSLYKFICNATNSYDKLKAILGDNLKEFAGQTDSYWKDLEPKGKRFMILSMESGNYVRPSNANGIEESYYKINNRFQIFDGIDYKSNNSGNKLLYMEV